MLTRIGILGLAVACIIGGTAKATAEIVREDMDARIQQTKVDAFNDGFVDGSCRNGSDGFGHYCR